MKRFCSITMIALLAAGITSCGGGADDENDVEVAERPTGRDVLSNATAPRPQDDRAARADVEVSTDTADDAIASFMNLLIAGELDAAVELCVPDSSGRAELARTAAGLDRAVEEGGMDRSTIVTMLTGDLKTITWEKTSEEDGRAVFRLSSPTHENRGDIEVVRTNGDWLVVPPPGGVP
ncbi:MAG: hypothetical protein EA376_02680 [Phycisphaeraceae bacterium]|nr:MAG: hypothetical protein EA376_02680 [Phycisphaeraceae bacterium]